MRVATTPLPHPGAFYWAPSHGPGCGTNSDHVLTPRLGSPLDEAPRLRNARSPFVQSHRVALIQSELWEEGRDISFSTFRGYFTTLKML